MQVMLGRFWACRRRMARSLLTHSPMTTMPRTKMRCHGYGESTLHQRGRQWYDRWVHRLTFTPPSSWVGWSLKHFFFLSLIRTGCSASSCLSVLLAMWSSSGVLNFKSVCWSPALISSTKTNTPSSYHPTITHHPTWRRSPRSRTTN